MEFDPAKYGAAVARILALDGGGPRLMPLNCGSCSCEEARRELQSVKPRELFPEAVHSDAAMAGLWLYFSCFEEAHQIADACGGKTGDYWHAIVHRQEPDSGNAKYWFHKVGVHGIFPALAFETNRITERVPEIEFRVGRWWAPYAFIAFCEQARQQPGSAHERAAMEIQRAEWQLLFDYCASPVEDVGLLQT